MIGTFVIKRTINIQNPVKLSFWQDQLKLSYKDQFLPDRTVPIEDLGFVVVEHPQVVFTHQLVVELMKANVVTVFCDQKYMPIGMTLPLYSNTLYTERLTHQVNCSLPLKKQLWQQTISMKIYNQYMHLKRESIPAQRMLKWSKEVKPGDEGNYESRAAVFYWDHIFGPNFKRDQDGGEINAALNYGYAILRSVTARALVGSGLLPSLGLFHRNKYNPFVLADDIMEPYRPFVDMHIKNWLEKSGKIEGIDTLLKTHLLQIPVLDVVIEKKVQPLMIAMSRTTHSLVQCFNGELRKIRYPNLE